MVLIAQHHLVDLAEVLEVDLLDELLVASPLSCLGGLRHNEFAQPPLVAERHEFGEGSLLLGESLFPQDTFLEVCAAEGFAMLGEGGLHEYIANFIKRSLPMQPKER